MAKLIYGALTSLDGYISGEAGNFDWAVPDEEVHAFINDLERKFDPVAVCKLKTEAARDVSVGGPALAAHAIRAGLVDEYHVFVTPIIVGGGNPYLPGNVRVSLELIDERGFGNGMVHVRYRARG